MDDRPPVAHMDIAGPSWTDSDQPLLPDRRDGSSGANPATLSTISLMELTGAGIIIEESLKKLGVDTVFGINSSAAVICPFSMRLYDSGIRVVLTPP